MKLFKYVIVLSFLNYINLFSTHNTNRYFPFLERPEDYIIKNKSHISPALFFTRASDAHLKGEAKGGIPELWGKYDLMDIIDGMQEVQGDSFVNPIQVFNGPADSWINKSVRYKVDEKIKTFGLLLNYEQQIYKNLLQLGASIPLMHVNTTDRYAFLQRDSASIFSNLKIGELNELDSIRRYTHDQINLKPGNWNKTGFGDLDFHLRLNKTWEYKLRLKRIDLDLQPGLIFPTGVKSDKNNPMSVPFMGNGHWSLYLDLITQIELKQDWIFGVLAGFAYQFDKTRNIRIPVYKEPAMFSALTRDIKISPGNTYKISPYIAALNLSDGLNLRARYTYLRHNKDKWSDNSNSSVKSYLNQTTDFLSGGKNITQEEIQNNIKNKKDLTKWSSHYITLQVDYDAKEASNKWFMDPIIFALVDYHFQGNASCQSNQVTLGVELHF